MAFESFVRISWSTFVHGRSRHNHGEHGRQQQHVYLVICLLRSSKHNSVTRKQIAAANARPQSSVDDHAARVNLFCEKSNAPLPPAALSELNPTARLSVQTSSSHRNARQGARSDSGDLYLSKYSLLIPRHHTQLGSPPAR